MDSSTNFENMDNYIQDVLFEIDRILYLCTFTLPKGTVMGIEETCEMGNDIKSLDIEEHVPQNKIKHIVISGGSIWGLYAFGCIKEAYRQGFLDINSIESMYGTSVGALVAVLLSLKLDVDWVDDYLIRRPWNKIIKMNVLDMYHNKGIIPNDFFEDFFKPLFCAKDIPVNVTLLELYNTTGIEIHMYAIELNAYELCDLSYKTHPDWRVVDAVHASCALPILISPLIQENNFWIDGGFFLNYPISKCLENVENKDTIFGISLGNPVRGEKKGILNKDSAFTDILINVFGRIIQNSVFINKEKGIIPFEVNMYSNEISMGYFTSILNSHIERSQLIEKGVQEMREHFTKWFS